MLATATVANKLFIDLLNAGLVVMLLTLVSSLGMGFTVRQVVAPLRRWVLLVLMVVVNVLVIPAVAWGLSELFPLSSAHRIGLVLVISVAAAPAGLKACQLAKQADMAMAVSFVVVLQLVNIVAAPLWARAVVSGASVQAWTIIKDLLLLVLLPLVVGLFVKARYSGEADKWKGGLERASNIALYIAIVGGIAGYWKEVTSTLGSWVIVYSIVIILVMTVLGAVIGVTNKSTMSTTGLLSSMRFTPIGLIVIVTQLHGQGSYLAPGLVFALIDTFIPFVFGAEIGRIYTKRQGASPTPTPPMATPSTSSKTA